MDNLLKPYNEDFNRIKAKVKKEVHNCIDKFYLRRFHFTIANLKNFYPEALEGRTSEEVYSELLYTRELAPLDAKKYATEIDHVQLRGDLERVKNGQGDPVIYCVNHLGSYRAIIGLLSKYGHDFSLVIDEQVFSKQGEGIRESVKRINEHFQTESDFDLINAEEFAAAMKMVKQIKQGKSLVIYIDGNTGTGGIFRHDEKLEVVEFFGKQILARQGIAYISFLTNVPIVPVCSFRENIRYSEMIHLNNTVMEFYEEIIPTKGVSKKEYCKSSIQLLYKYLEEKTREHPLQWEGWLYVHKYLDESKIESVPNSEYSEDTDIEQVEFNEERYGLFILGAKYFMFDSSTYKSFLIDEEDFQFFQSFMPDKKKTKKTTDSKTTETNIRQLLKIGILTPCSG